MQENDKAVLVYATFPTLDEAENVGCPLVDQGLAACVNIIPGMTSIYVWHGQRHRETETVMLIKSRESLAARIIDEVKRRHSYDTPALVVLPVEGGSKQFLAWIMDQTSTPKASSSD